MAPAAVWPLATLVGPPPVVLMSGAAPPAPKGARERVEQGSPNTGPGMRKNSCKGRYSSPRFGARVARLNPPRMRNEFVSAASTLTLNVVALGAALYEE